MRNVKYTPNKKLKVLHLNFLYRHLNLTASKNKDTYKKIIFNLKKNNHPWLFYLQNYFTKFNVKPVLYGSRYICESFLSHHNLNCKKFSEKNYLDTVIKFYVICCGTSGNRCC